MHFILFAGAGGHPQEVSLPLNIITTGGQTFAVASNLQGGIPQANQMQIRPIAPNAATVVGHLNNIAAQQIRKLLLLLCVVLRPIKKICLFLFYRPGEIFFRSLGQSFYHN